jgi:hypothetical protein
VQARGRLLCLLVFMLASSFDERRLSMINPGGRLIPGPEDGRQELQRALAATPFRRNLYFVYLSGRRLRAQLQDIAG